MSRNLAPLCLWLLGHPDRALDLNQEGVSLAKRVEHAYSLASALNGTGITHCLRLEPALTRECMEECIALSAKFGFPYLLGVAKLHRGWARAHLGEGEQGVAEIEQGLAEVGGLRETLGGPDRFVRFAEAIWTVGRHDDALGALELGDMLSEQQGQRYWDAELHRLRAEILLDKNGASAKEVEDLFHRALEIAQSQEAKSLELRAATSLARLWQSQGKTAEARAVLAPVYDWFTEGSDTTDLKDAKALLEELS